MIREMVALEEVIAHINDLSAQILNYPELSQKLLGEFVPIIYKGLQATA